MGEQNQILKEVTKQEYKYGFTTPIESDKAPKGLNEDIIRFISHKKQEPEWLLEWRLNAFEYWQSLLENHPGWGHLEMDQIDFQDIIYYAAPKKKKELESLDEVDPELLKTFDKLGISIEEQKRLSGVAVDVVMDSVSVKTTFKEILTWLSP